MMATFDVIVLGAGPAGAEAAMSAAARGCSVALLDEQPAAGGQIWRAPVGRSPNGPDLQARSGDDLRRRLTASPVNTCFGHRVWSVGQRNDGARTMFRVDSISGGASQRFEAPALVVATGAHERVTPFPGWTLPGVIGLAAATVLVKSHGVVPGRRIVVAGCGPLLAVVSGALVKAGVTPLAVADLSRPAAWLRRLPAILRRPSPAVQGAVLAARVALSGTPFLPGHGIRLAEGDTKVQRVVLGPVDQDGAPVDGAERAFEVDTLIVGHGLTTACEVTRLMRCAHRFDRLRGGWVPEVDGVFQTSVPGLYAIGDGAGVRGQEAATLAGRRVGLHLASSFGKMEGAEAGSIDAALARLAPFSDAIAGLMAQRPPHVAAITPETIICRCEDITRSEVDAAIAAGAADLQQLKHFTRCGMGPCQGRYCADTVQELMAQKLARTRETIGQWTGRPPLRPVALGELIGEFSYDDIPIPEPAPL